MFKKLAILFALITIAVFALAACGSAPTTGAVKTTPVVAETKDLSGTWTTTNPDTGAIATATIKDGTITIYNGRNDDSNFKSLYWKGTFPQTGSTINSIADRDALDVAILASQDTSKEFIYKNNHLSYTEGMMGMSWTMTLHKS